MSWLARFNSASSATAEADLMKACGCARFAVALAARRPFATAEALYAAAEREWAAMGEAEWREAMSHHPRIGDPKALREKWTAQEQSGANRASSETLERLVLANQEYESRFGHVFLICATGKSADEMLAALRSRLSNSPQVELKIAAGEQAKITRIRLEKLVNS